MIDEQKLRELAEAATPGPWFVVGQPWNPKADFIVAGSPDPHMGQYVADTEDFDGEGQNVQENAAYIASANPSAILALLDELQSLRSDRTTKNTEGSEMNSETSKLQETKECPFCGNSWGQPQAEVDKESGRWTVGCMNPRCGASSGYCDTEDEAVNLWNTRAGEAQ
ncbi:ead/Ea22-like family protein [Hydrogenophaga aromaticivorans]|uniref:ead/Ea22-like family protein n=1 Tax=Hydrogenophaga aromaticivorans TaxID=2610898 RepID=UPI001B3898A6|nr:ead/Ea22-like family protein [Hydrogenophaga aromaticivorans]MBQ0917502.1 ead/Ea22-like family protein [Hydrogenophaga aromaticivorans]